MTQTELNQALLEILACPSCRSALVVDYEASELVCAGPECGLAYPVRGSIPVLLVDEARRPGEPAAEEPDQTAEVPEAPVADASDEAAGEQA